MTQEVIQKLVEVNRKFYENSGADFDSSRDYYWSGWEKLKPFVKDGSRVLDVGCGNGRFGCFLAESGLKVEYTGVDFSERLLDAAKGRLEKCMRDGFRLIHSDLVEGLEVGDEYDLIISSAVFHHIPSYLRRVSLLKTLSNLLHPSGHLVLTGWEFTKYPRLMNKVTDWEKVGLAADEVEEGDFLLTWERGESGLRYVHYLNEDEVNEMVMKTSLKIHEIFYADGKDNEMNRYYVVSRGRSSTQVL